MSLKFTSFLLLLSLFIYTSDVKAQTEFCTVKSNLIQNTNTSELPTKYKLVNFDLNEFNKLSVNIPKEFSASPNFEITLPLLDGKTESFSLFEYEIMEPGLRAKYPNIKTYHGYSSNYTPIRITTTDTDFQALILGTYNTIIEKNTFLGEYITYQLNDFSAAYDRASCGHSLETIVNPDQLINFRLENKYQGDSTRLRKYRFAVSTTGEYSARYGGTATSVMAEVVRVTNAINSVYERDASIRLVLIANTDILFTYDPSTDPFTPGVALDNAGENQSFVNSKILNTTYDVGHVFGLSGGGGIVGYGPGRVCSNNKAAGSSNMYSGGTASFAIELVCHELGHQFSAGHSFNACSFTESYEWSGHDMEPGSGSTIMSYSGSCGSNNLAFNSDHYFHGISIQYITDFSRNGNAATCANAEDIQNTAPNITLLQPDGLFIPKSTPFELNSIAVDKENNPVTYCWEQFDSGLKTPLGSPVGDGPSFRSFLPKTTGLRIFPSLNKIISNTFDNAEILPTYSRSFRFRMTARDNKPGGGAQSWAENTFFCDSTAGPFVITAPSGSTSISINAPYLVTWDVARTNLAPINCKNVNIFASYDNGFNITDTLLLNTPNDGSALVQFPNKLTSIGRIYVKAADNIFFNISRGNFLASVPTTAKYAANALENELTFCSNVKKNIVLKTHSFNGFSSPIVFSIEGNVPANGVITLEQNSVTPGQNNMLNIDFRSIIEGGTFNFIIVASSEGDTVRLPITLNVYASNFNGLTLTNPLHQASGVSQLPQFNWSSVQDATSYIFQLATSPIFGDSIKLAVETANTTLTPSIQLKRNTVYYWRVIPKNNCGTGAPTPMFVFQTALFACQTVSNTQSFNISQSGTPTVNVPINIINGGEIADVNVKKITGSHDYFSELSFKLIHPDGTVINLAGNSCGSFSLGFNFGFDDQAATVFTCPPTQNKQFRPLTPLSGLTGKNSTGLWNLRVSDGISSGGGTITGVEIEFCAGYSVASPNLTSDTIKLCRDLTVDIKGKLSASNSTLAASQFKYTLVTLPTNGRLELNNNALSVGSKFTQQDINNNAVRYVPNGTYWGNEKFTFVVEDATGGWKGIEAFNILIDNCSNTENELLPSLFSIYPNPAYDKINIIAQKPWSSDPTIKLFASDGKLLHSKKIDKTLLNYSLDLKDLESGAYFITIFTSEGFFTKNLVVHKP